ncbi:helix-turn-helix domain-containing protein [Sphingobium sp. AN641]|uniref:GlxA family transcriptional regulator n=1 Tax=Sphingobium sp. AN641 TaxID=3133443 RepID=UPI0030BE1924
MTYTIGFVVHAGFQLQHVAGPLSIFEAVPGYGAPVYRAMLLSEQGQLVHSSAGVCVDTMAFDEVEQLDILFICGGYACFEAERSPAIAAFIRHQSARCRHVAAVSSGTVILAASGVLTGHRVTSHWSLNGELADIYPSIQVEGDEFIVRDGKFWTSTSVMGGADIAQRIIDEDLGHDAAKRATRELLGHHRPVGDGQVIDGDERFKSLVTWARRNLNETLSVEQMAEHMGMHPRNFVPAFTTALGQTPAKAVERIRLEAALALVGRSDLPPSAIARQVGFGSADRMRRAFVRVFGVPPQSMRVITQARAAQLRNGRPPPMPSPAHTDS